MYRSASPGQLSFESFYLPFGGKLSSNNRWVKMSELIPWENLEHIYAEKFSDETGAPALKFRVALGALIIKEKLGCDDREVVEQIRENPYLQYFIGMGQYSDKAPFHPSMLVHFRKRLDIDAIRSINELIITSCHTPETSESEPQVEVLSEDDVEHRNHQQEAPNRPEASEAPPNRGKMLADATCAPADISYPTDLKLLNQAREYTEKILDILYTPLKDNLKQKPRTYRKIARKAYLKTAKKRQVSRKQRRAAVGQQLRYVQRNLRHIKYLLEQGASLTWLNARQYRLLLVVTELYRQQLEMYEKRIHRIDDRIVSLTQPHVRPIVRGKAGTPVEFGAKLSLSWIDGYVYLDHLDWNNFNESGDLIEQIEAYRKRTGFYPESVHVDLVYRTRANCKWCQAHNIRLCGPPLGRPKAHVSIEEKKQAQADERARVPIEGKFGQGKRRFSLGHVMTKLAETSATSIAITILVINLERLLRQLLFVFYFCGIVSERELKKSIRALRTSINFSVRELTLSLRAQWSEVCI